MKKLCIAVLATVMLASCMKQNTDVGFDAYKNVFIESLWKQYPVWASGVGYHAYDSILPIPDEASRAQELVFVTDQEKALSEFDPANLSDQNKTDFYLIRNALERIRWSIEKEKGYQWDPSGYNVCGLFAEMLNNNYDSLDMRLHQVGLRLKAVPLYYAAAAKNLVSPTREHTELAISQNEGGLSVFEADLPAALERSHLSDTENAASSKDASSAVAAIKGYIDVLRNTKYETRRDFRLGRELYEKKFEYDIQSGYSLDQLYEKALARKTYLHRKMAELALHLWPTYGSEDKKPKDTLELISRVINAVSQSHVHADSFQFAIEQQIPQLIDFVKQKDLLYIDPSKPLVVRKEPDYMAGVAGASISSPGPYDKSGNTYYNVGSFGGWPKERIESYLREYNRYVLQILNIHEAIPGHYTQLVYSNQSPSLVKSVFGNGSMIEGWAVYTELMMLENGYGNNSPEMWLMYYKWNLRTVCNTLLDISVHTRGMSQADALNLLVNEAFQQQAEAEGKWRRVSVTSVQLTSYFNGFSEICELRERIQQKEKEQFNLKAFHEKFLSYGSAPVKYIAQMMY